MLLQQKKNIGGSRNKLKQNKIYRFFNNIVETWFNEYKVIFRDSGVITLFIIAVLVYPLLYSLAYNNELAKEVPIVVVDKNDSDLSRKLISMLDATDEVQVLYKLPDFNEAKILFDKSDVYGVIDIPEDFDKKILRFETATISVYADASYMLIYKQIMMAANYAVGTMSAGIEIQRRISKGNQLEEAFIERDPMPVETYSLYNPKGGYASYAMPAVLLLILQQTLLLGIGLIGGTQREKGFIHFLVPIGIKRGGSLSIIFGKSLAFFSIYLINTLYVLVVVFRMFNLPMRGNYFEIFVFLTPFLFAVIYLGMTFAAFFKKREHALMLLLFTSIPFVFLSGFSWPNYAMPQWQVWFSKIIPSTPAIQGFLALSQKSASFHDVFYNWLHLWGLMLFYITTASLLLKRMVKKAR